jgi:hypothetical protein
MQTLARNILQTFLFEKKTPKAEDLEKIKAIPKQKVPIFITVSDAGVVVASSGKVYPTHDIYEELIENTVNLVHDPRFWDYKDNPEKARKLEYRVDIFHDSDRRMLHHPDEIDGKNEGMIVVCQKQKKVGIILPHMLSENLSGEEIYHQVARKINLDTHNLGKWDLILYAIKTEIFQD